MTQILASIDRAVSRRNTEALHFLCVDLVLIANRGGVVDARDLVQLAEAMREEMLVVDARIRQVESDLRRDLKCAQDRSMDLEWRVEVLEREIRAAKAAVTPTVQEEQR